MFKENVDPGKKFREKTPDAMVRVSTHHGYLFAWRQATGLTHSFRTQTGRWDFANLIE